MTLRRIDSRFLLPHPVQRAVVLPGIDGWGEELSRLGVQLGGDGSEPLDLVVAPVDRAERGGGAAAARGDSRGTGRRRLAGLSGRAYLPLPADGEPLVYVPHGSPGPARYAFATWAYADSAWKRLRNRAVGELAAHHLLPPIRPEVIVGSRPA